MSARSRAAVRGLIVNADDLGLSALVDAGIVRAHRDGVVTSTSLLAGGPSAAPAMERVAREAPRLAVGLHVDLSGLRPGGPLAVVRALESIPAAEVEEACEVQLDAFARLGGRPPDHMDCHQHLAHLHPVAFGAYLEVARRHRLPVRSPEPFVTAAALAAFLERVERENGVPLAAALPPAERLAADLAAVWAAACVRAPDRFEHAFYGTRATVVELVRIVCEADEGVTEVMCHPAEAGAAGHGHDAARAQELDALVDPQVRRAVEAAGVRLMTFGDV